MLIAAGYYVNGPTWLSSTEIDDSAEGPLTLVNPTKTPGGDFNLTFNAAPGMAHTILTITDPSSTMSKWTVLGVAPEFAPGLFIFTDTQSGTGAQRFYGVRSP